MDLESDSLDGYQKKAAKLAEDYCLKLGHVSVQEYPPVLVGS